MDIRVCATHRHFIYAFCWIIRTRQQHGSECTRCFFFAASFSTDKEICMNGRDGSVLQLFNGAALANH
jgi:hypothetical protein